MTHRIQARLLWPLILTLGAAIGLLVSLNPLLARNPTLGLATLTVLALTAALLFRAPEILFALYISVGSYKAGLLPLQKTLGLDFTVALAMFVIAAIVFKALRRIDHIRLHWLILSVFLLLAGWMFFSTTWSSFPSYGLEKSARFATLTLMAFAAPILLLDSWRSLERFFWAVFLAGMLFATQALIDLYAGGELRRLVTVLGADYLTVGRMCGLAAGLGTYFSINGRTRRWVRLVLLICVGMAISVTLLGASRGPMVAWLLAFVPPALLRRRWNRRAFFVLRILLVFLIFLGIGLALGLVPREVISRFDVLFGAFFRGDPDAVRLTPRIHIWQVGLDLFLQHPIVGIGVGAYRTSVRQSEFIYPHNLLLEAGAELGFVGLTLTFLLITIPLVRWRRCSRIQLPNRYMLLFDMSLWVYTFFFVEVMKSGDFNSNRTFWMSIGTLMSVCTLSIREARSRVTSGAEGFSRETTPGAD